MKILYDSEQWESLVDTLRLELQEYGGLINMLDEQQRGILGRDADNLLGANLAIEAQIQATNELRSNRESMVSKLAVVASQDQDSRLSDLVRFFPESARPLVSALIEDCHALVEKIRRRARQNQMLLTRATELTEEVLQALRPQAFTKTYDLRGGVSVAKMGQRGDYIQVSV